MSQKIDNALIASKKNENIEEQLEKMKSKFKEEMNSLLNVKNIYISEQDFEKLNNELLIIKKIMQVKEIWIN